MWFGAGVRQSLAESLMQRSLGVGGWSQLLKSCQAEGSFRQKQQVHREYHTHLASSLLPTLPFKASKNNLFLLHSVTSHPYWCLQSLVLPKWEHISFDAYFLGLRYPEDP